MIASIALAALLLQGPGASAESMTALPDQWKYWLYSAPIEVGVITLRRMVRVTVPMTAFRRSQAGLPDLRIIDDTGREIPYVIDIERGSQVGGLREAPQSEYGFVRGSYTQVVADTGEGRKELIDTLRIDSSNANYFSWVEIAASDDETSWRVIREQAPIFKFRRDALAGTQTVSFPATRARWLRVRVLEPDAAFPIDDILVGYRQVRPAELAPWPLAFKENPKEDTQQTWLEADAGAPRLPGAVVEIDAQQVEYHRPVRISVSDDAGTFTEIGEGVIASGASTQTARRIEFQEGGGRYWRITVFNHNDPPVTGLSATLLASPRHVSFRQEPGRTYRLLYGDNRATAPQYDVADLTTAAERSAAPTVNLGAEQTNAAYVDPAPWTEQHPVILWIALAIAVLVMGGLAIRTLRR
ncbi:MAG TPA: DUF3999 family protein [Candidatus Tumulicola sp.]|nr:DUF3999 family protein [Candidatus Tumulicola sp.]